MSQTNGSPSPREVNIKIERDKSGAYFATSPELKGLLVAKMTFLGLCQDLPRAIGELYAADRNGAGALFRRDRTAGA